MGDDNPWIVEANKPVHEWRTIAIIPMPEGDVSEDDEIPRLEAEKNAKLLVAAPDLLKALQEIERGLANTNSNKHRWLTSITKPDAWVIAAEAIKKAI